MANVERQINLEKGPNSVVLTTTNRETFVSLEEMLKQKKREVRNGNIAMSLRAIGIAGLLGGLGLVIAGITKYNQEILLSGLASITVANVFIVLTREPLEKKLLAQEQLKEIKK